MDKNYFNVDSQLKFFQNWIVSYGDIRPLSSLKTAWEYLFFFNRFDEENIRQIIKHDSFSEGWKFLSIYQDLSQKFIEEYSEFLDWDSISAFQKLDYDFIVKFQDDINFGLLLFNNKIRREIFDLIKQDVILKDRINQIKAYDNITIIQKDSFESQTFKHLFLKYYKKNEI